MDIAKYKKQASTHIEMGYVYICLYVHEIFLAGEVEGWCIWDFFFTLFLYCLDAFIFFFFTEYTFSILNVVQLSKYNVNNPQKASIFSSFWNRNLLFQYRCSLQSS